MPECRMTAPGVHIQMLFYAFLFFVVACIAALAGFNDIAPSLAVIARLVAYAFLALAAITALIAIVRR
ncbi:MAG TPA: DUF1328 domain-containing protein [Burkholderiales bacterium]|nr:DUF1328 domain-containing protein [Burkholderiales bacterium]